MSTTPFAARPWRLALAAAAVLAAGCSALQIDVDVYKGPLANEPATQVRQFAALAVSAKPLLASLRNDFEDTLRGQDGALQQAVGSAARLDAYLPEDRVRLQSRLARFVNGALWSYEDQEDGPGHRAHQAWADVQAALQRMEVRPGLDDVLAARVGNGSSDAHKAFAQAYRCWLAPGQQDAKPCGDWSPGRYRPTDALHRSCAAAWAHEAPQLCPRGEGANALYDAFSDPAVVSRHARLLLGRADPDFVDRVVEIARAFHASREGMQVLLQASLQHLQLASAGQVDGAAALVSALVQPAALECAVADPQLLPDMGPGSAAEAFRQWARAEAPPARMSQVVLKHLLSARPIAGAGMLQALDQRVQDRAREGHEMCVKTGRSRAHPLAYGLSRGPTNSDELSALLDGAIGRGLQQLPRASVAGFERARLGPGIETLTQRYQEELNRHQHRTDHPEVVRALSRLEEALIFFAERVLFVINNTTYDVLEDEFGPARATQLLARGEGVLVERQAAGVQTGRVAARMAVLQTLGNTLMLHANDLRRRQTHLQAQRDAGPAELRAAQAALVPGADLAFDAYLLHARQALARKQADATQAEQALQQAQAALSPAQTAAAAALKKADAALAEAQAGLPDLRARLAELEAAVRTLVPVAERKGLFPVPTDLVAARREAGDAAELELALLAVAEAGGAAATVAPADLLPALQTWLTATGAKLDGAHQARLRAAQAVLVPGSVWLSSAWKPAPRAQALATLKQGLLAEARTYQQQVSNQQAKVDEQTRLKADAQAQVAAAEKQAGSAETRQQQAQSAVTDAQAIAQRIEALRTEVIMAAAGDTVRDAAGIQRLLLSALRQRQEKSGADAPSAEEKKLLQATRDFLARLTPPSSFALADLPAGHRAPEPREVLDQVIAALRHQRIQAQASGDTARADNLLKAINTAYDARAGAAFLRPASDYLRNVYSATNLQDGGVAARGNMLDDYLKDILPGGEQGAFEQRSRQAREQVEKLYWQNINRVSLSAGGNSNYVLAKDDVGNWYVKAYSADPSSAIRSAQSLALFGAGRPINTNLLRRLDLQRVIDGDGNDQGKTRAQTELDTLGASENIGLEKVRARYAETYRTQVEAQAEMLRVALSGLGTETLAAIEAAKAETPALAGAKPDAVAPLLAAAQAGSLAVAAQIKAAQELPPLDADRLARLEDHLATGLVEMRGFYVGASAKLLAGNDDLGAADARAVMAKLVKDKTRDRLKAQAIRLKAALDQFDAGLQVIGEAKSAR